MYTSFGLELEALLIMHTYSVLISKKKKELEALLGFIQFFFFFFIINKKFIASKIISSQT